MMASESEKAIIELGIFAEFIGKTLLPVDHGSITKPGYESEPDIFCKIRNEDIAFELVEICSSYIAETLSQLRAGKETAAIAGLDPTERIVVNKLRKSYRTPLPIELLCYTKARAITTDEQIFEEIRRCANTISGPFRKIWLLGEKDVYEVWPD